ncbi:MAG: hypothetical protein K0R28_339 [Paenibacillus sp.]|nr:hypothetical protein [Paenibacillus sp.]
MLDLYMILSLAGTYVLFAGFMAWCGKVIDDTGVERK